VIPIHHFSSLVIGDILRRQPESAARTRLAWQMAVGPALARVTSVDLASGVLTVRAADSRWTDEINRARAVIVKRLQDLLGTSHVHTLHIEL
jgi:hypothetical protein